MRPKEYRQRAFARSPMLPNFRDQMLLCALGAGGEVGEIEDIVKKHVFHGKPLDHACENHLIEEVGDAIWYLDRLLALFDITMEEMLSRNDRKLEERYPAGFKRQDEGL